MGWLCQLVLVILIEIMTMFLFGWLLGLVGMFWIFLMRLRFFMILLKREYCGGRLVLFGFEMMKNWLLLVFGFALVMVSELIS